MTHNLQKLYRFVKQRTVVNRFVLRTKKTSEIRGYADRSSITICTHVRNKAYGVESSVLIHEFGHVLAFAQIGKSHTEADAWVLGAKTIPGELLPPHYFRSMKSRLSTYPKKQSKTTIDF